MEKKRVVRNVELVQPVNMAREIYEINEPGAVRHNVTKRAITKIICTEEGLRDLHAEISEVIAELDHVEEAPKAQAQEA